MDQTLIGTLAFVPDDGFSKHSLQGWDETLEVALHDLIVRAGFHGRDWGLLADRAGHEDWVYRPTLKRRVACTARDRFFGSASSCA
jgi:hypothetical protein